MAIPSGSGTEVMKVAYTRGVSNTSTLIMPAGTADHIYVILSIVIVEDAGVNEAFYLNIRPSGSSANQTRLIRGATINAGETFVWNDKFVMSGTDELRLETGSAADLDAVVSYIDQDWS